MDCFCEFIFCAPAPNGLRELRRGLDMCFARPTCTRCQLHALFDGVRRLTRLAGSNRFRRWGLDPTAWVWHAGAGARLSGRLSCSGSLQKGLSVALTLRGSGVCPPPASGVVAPCRKSALRT